MTILGRGDLAPLRRRSRWGRRVLVVFLACVLGAGSYVGYHAWRGSGSPGKPATLPTPCATATNPPAPLAVSAVTVTVMNGTGKVGLAHTVAGELKGRGFTVAKVGNTPAPVTGASEVFYGPGQQPAAVSVAEQLPEVLLRLRPAAGVELDIGSLFTGLASPAQVIAEHTRDLAAASVVHRCPASP